MTSNNERPSYCTFKFLTVVFLLFFMPACSSDTGSSGTYTINYWVATNGSDQASGDSDNPFLTLEHARDVIRANGNRGICTINVNIKAGTYRLSSPLKLNAGDSGAPGAEVVYQAAPGESVVISGAQ